MADIAPIPKQHDLDILHRLATRKVELARDPVNCERREAWYRLDSGEGDRPMILAEPFAVADAHSPGSHIELECEDEWARGLEGALRREFYLFDVIKDDHVIEPFWNVGWKAGFSSGYGVDVKWHKSSTPGVVMGAQRWDPALENLDSDLDKLHKRTYAVDRDATVANKARLEAVFGDILPVRIRGGYWWTMGLTMDAAVLVGIEQLMMAMYDNPDGLHRLMTFLRDDMLAFAEWLEKEELFTLNNENDGIGSGSLGYTRDLPQRKNGESGPVRMKDLWVLTESQETVGVGPDQFEEFVFPYQLSIAEKFGKSYHGCCEPVHTRIGVLKKMKNLARVSVSPWADEEIMARELGRDYVYSRKPNPAIISTEVFDETAIRDDIARTLRVAKGCRIEFIMKDVHTLNNEPDRIARWVQQTRAAIDTYA